MATPSLEVRILRDLEIEGVGEDWLECEDSFGLFYFNRRTQMATLELPPVVAAIPIEAPVLISDPVKTQEPVVLSCVGEWVVAKDDLGLFYYNTSSLESYDEPPPALLLLLQKMQAAQLCEERSPLRQRRPQRHQKPWQRQCELRRIWEQKYGQQQPHHAPSRIQTSHSAHGHDEAIVQMRIANWAVARDSRGEFYQNMASGETFDEPPCELRCLFQQRMTFQAQDKQNVPLW
eukprot:CAMPEP_0170631240 /NCGR_PEP_ID=MMETSP0224-20130122/34508_1 /TAXON_ID=285029 /ORGANISM="Togula jolla, Strain CCCM 725" /LENGTH=232 /DNA_ID=CAMNT_0010959511 /DNA_START=60 /DNA_END=755 /DNA_ORIENTATION=+